MVLRSLLQDAELAEPVAKVALLRPGAKRLEIVNEHFALMKVDIDGNVIWKPDTEYQINPSGYVIHGAIHRARPDVSCVIHRHTRGGMAVSAMEEGVLPITQTSMRFYGHIGYHDYEGPAVDLSEQECLVADLGAHNALVLRNHGLLTCGPSVPEASNLMYQMEMSCRAQVDVMTAHAGMNLPDADVLAHTANQYQPGTRRPYGVLEWHTMQRLLRYEGQRSPYPAFDS